MRLFFCFQIEKKNSSEQQKHERNKKKSAD